MVIDKQAGLRVLRMVQEAVLISAPPVKPRIRTGQVLGIDHWCFEILHTDCTATDWWSGGFALIRANHSQRAYGAVIHSVLIALTFIVFVCKKGKRGLVGKRKPVV
ncbi:hypothetical protein BDV34DRAFT_194733 [Aspergillus parasiticus]|uniref:Uncharacterized protein n=1 Tax=Aspergillus parasiticus TaxID=5067 RepID=A0A5N6DM09_ASPPA|nr:hypothetical protein BDV34DRAFT_194733 [Aspergillus parasiticus]